MIDLHAHLLPGIDDGPDTIRDSLAMARVAVAGGTTTIVCTPHVHDSYPTTPDQVHEGVARLSAVLAEEEIPLRVLPGAEIALGRLDRLDDDSLRRLSLGGSGWLLLELPFRGWPIGLGRILADLEIRGFRAVLAHPERAESVQLAPDRVRDAVGRGALLQVTAGSFTDDHGPRARRAALALLRGGVAHLLASDAHRAGWRPPLLGDGLARAASALRTAPERLSWMVDEGPRLVIEGGPVRPPRLAAGDARGRSLQRLTPRR